ncbi:PD-(D/E)XK nuclease family protein [Caldibacillus lycopersici]|uniref:PD-(D/E)XK nuclease family protein n=1 Tax=Perspicuibacillus lycopersici TaxID=1325689 RepID=A0AAE3IUN4_9BACI|nr:PD-(D/E)XK nuclease family protein [Perspicuibacillus lycopersici]MCU9614918.1 PD-(D/E)XK nuclease family protein [Perspicuibacillus lycopersici]
MNTFDALNIFYKEDTISDFLIHCFKDDNNQFLACFLQEAKIFVDNNASFEIETRVGLGKAIGTPDVIIKATSDSEIQLIIIENKMGSAEGNEQTNRYESLEARKRMAKRFNIDLTDTKFHFIFLALDTTTRPKNSKYVFLNYQLFLSGDWPLKDPTLSTIFKDFQETLHRFYEPMQTPYKSLASNVEMDGMQRKICWQNILYETMSTNPNLDLRWGEVAGAGRNNFLFLITKKNWYSSEPHTEVGLTQTFYIHIDVYINLLNKQKNGIREIGIRFETHPYEPHDKIKHLPGYETFMSNKQMFQEKLLEITKQHGIETKSKNTKLLVMTLPIKGTTIRDTVQQIKQQVNAIEGCIDKVVAEMVNENLLN